VAMMPRQYRSAGAHRFGPVRLILTAIRSPVRAARCPSWSEYPGEPKEEGRGR
jgi:hypothetical protein